MADRSKIRPGDIILYQNQGWIGNAIAWSEWDGGRGNYAYSHIGHVFSETHSAEMNPPCSRIFSLDEIKWEHVDIYRFNIGGKNPFDDPATLKAFQDYINPKRLGMKYNYGFIFKSLGIGLLARIGFQKWAQKWATHTDADTHTEVCSEFCQDNAEYAIPEVDLFPDRKGIGIRPSDWPLCPYLVKVE